MPAPPETRSYNSTVATYSELVAQMAATRRLIEHVEEQPIEAVVMPMQRRIRA
jgi:hypothetical protein